jgi:hypothetical protein
MASLSLSLAQLQAVLASASSFSRLLCMLSDYLGYHFLLRDQPRKILLNNERAIWTVDLFRNIIPVKNYLYAWYLALTLESLLVSSYIQKSLVA